MPRNLGGVRPFDNVEIMNRIRNDASYDYQRRVPDVTKANVTETVRGLMQYTPAWNEFTDALINRVGSYITRDISWKNPLAPFKRNSLQFGDTIEEVQAGLLRAYSYSPDREYGEKAIFGTEKPDIASQFHTVNRQEFYKITVNRDQLRRAFLDDSGLQTYLNQILQMPATSDSWDEFLLTMSLLREYQDGGGFWHTQVPDLQSLGATKADGETFIKKVQACAGNLRFLDTKYNAGKMPVWARPEDLILITTPEVIANINVSTWAAAFNLDKQQMEAQIISVPRSRINIDGAQAILTTKDFFVIADNLLENTSQPNPVSLGQNYFLHHWEVISASLFVPAVLFWTGADDEKVNVVTPKNLELKPDAFRHADGRAVSSTDKMKPGENGYLTYSIVGTDLPGDAEIPVDFTMVGNKSPRTRVYNDGVFVIASDETATSVTISGRIVGGGALKANADQAKAGGAFSWSLDIDPAPKLWPKK